jgi:hypothetical protein
MKNSTANVEPNIAVVSKYSENSIVVFDRSTQTLEFYLPQDNLESVIAGSGNASITDGVGTNASFKDVSKIVCRDNKIYLIDDYRNLRKVEYINNEYKVTTLISNYSDNIDDLAVDQDGELFALVNGQGIMKLNSVTNKLDVFKGGYNLTITPDKSYESSISWENGVFKMYIKNSDLYLVNGLRIVKISDFKSKL